MKYFLLFIGLRNEMNMITEGKGVCVREKYKIQI